MEEVDPAGKWSPSQDSPSPGEGWQLSCSGSSWEKPRYEQASHCRECDGCLIMKSEKACLRCHGCLTRSGCNEYNRLCFNWDRAATNYFTGSLTSGVSSVQLNLAVEDLGRYWALVNCIKEKAIAIELALDDFPLGHPNRTNPRYSRE